MMRDQNQEDTMTNTKTPKMELLRTSLDGKPAFELVVRNAAFAPGLSDLCDGLGIMPTVDMANRRGIIVTTPEQLDAVREPLKHLFAHTGDWVSQS
jgi:hypothetical protein